MGSSLRTKFDPSPMDKEVLLAYHCLPFLVNKSIIETRFKTHYNGNMSNEIPNEIATDISKKAEREVKKFFNRHPLIWILAILVIATVLFILTPTSNPLAQEEATTDISIDEALALPAFSNTDIIVQHTGYTLSYAEEYEQPYWVAYVLTADKVFSTNSERQDNFHEDPYIPTGSATLADYKGSGYDRGHLIPAADQKWSEEAMNDSFYLSNMSPQVGSFNRGIWAKLESVVRTFAAQNQVIYVVTGPVLTDGPYERIGINEVAVPNYYYKAILDYEGDEHKAIGFLLKNEGSSADLTTFAVSIDYLEEVTGLDFFPALPDDEEDILEASYDVTLWDFSDFNASTLATKYGYNLSLGEYTVPVETTQAQPETFTQYVLYFLYENFGAYKIEIISWCEDAIAKVKNTFATASST